MSKTIGAENFFSRNYGREFYNGHSQPVIVAIDLKSPMNIGGIIRLASNAGCSKVIFTGDKEHFRHRKIKKTATNAFGKIDWEICDKNDWRKKIPDDYTIVAVETAENSTNIFNTPLPDKIAIVVGNERFGLDEETISQCDSVVYIPMPGHTLSMNVAQATAVAMFEWIRQQHRKK